MKGHRRFAAIQQLEFVLNTLQTIPAADRLGEARTVVMDRNSQQVLFSSDSDFNHAAVGNTRNSVFDGIFNYGLN